jgi:hypothetical protein
MIFGDKKEFPGDAGKHVNLEKRECPGRRLQDLFAVPLDYMGIRFMRLTSKLDWLPLSCLLVLTPAYSAIRMCFLLPSMSTPLDNGSFWAQCCRPRCGKLLLANLVFPL